MSWKSSEQWQLLPIALLHKLFHEKRFSRLEFMAAEWAWSTCYWFGFAHWFQHGLKSLWHHIFSRRILPCWNYFLLVSLFRLFTWSVWMSHCLFQLKLISFELPIKRSSPSLVFAVRANWVTGMFPVTLRTYRPKYFYGPRIHYWGQGVPSTENPDRTIDIREINRWTIRSAFPLGLCPRCNDKMRSV